MADYQVSSGHVEDNYIICSHCKGDGDFYICDLCGEESDPEKCECGCTMDSITANECFVCEGLGVLSEQKQKEYYI